MGINKHTHPGSLPIVFQILAYFAQLWDLYTCMSSDRWDSGHKGNEWHTELVTLGLYEGSNGPSWVLINFKRRETLFWGSLCTTYSKPDPETKRMHKNTRHADSSTCKDERGTIEREEWAHFIFASTYKTIPCFVNLTADFHLAQPRFIQHVLKYIHRTMMLGQQETQVSCMYFYLERLNDLLAAGSDIPSKR